MGGRMSGILKANIIITYCASFVYGICVCFIEDQRLSIMLSLLAGILMTQFVALHASSVNKPIPSWSKSVIFFTWPLSMHLVLLYCKGFKGLGISLLHLALYIAMPMISLTLMSLVLG